MPKKVILTITLITVAVVVILAGLFFISQQGYKVSFQSVPEILQTPAQAPQSLQTKIQTLKTDVPQWLENNFQGRTQLEPLIQKFNQLLQAGRFQEAERITDEILTLLSSGVIPTPADLPPKPGPETTSAPETRYITFALSIPMRACDQTIFRQGFEKSVGQIRTNVGTLGNNKNRKLGFALYVPAWEVEKMSGEDKDGAACYKLLVDTAVDVAIENNVAVNFMIGTHINWDTRPDLWNHFDPEAEGYNPDNVDNVEWHDWSGTPNKQNYIGWLPGGRAAPVMCFNCPGITSEITRMINTIFAPTILSARETFTQAGKPELFAGIIVGDELQIPNWGAYPENNQIIKLMREDGVEPTRLGYHALTNLGFTEADEPIDYVTELGKVNRDFLAFWDQLFNEAGFKRDELFTRHQGGQSDYNINHAPLWTAVNSYASPGINVYGALRNGFQDIYDLLDEYDIETWAGTEGNPATPPACLSGDISERLSTHEWLKRHFDHGAMSVLLNANDGRDIIRNCLETAMWDEESIRAYNDFLNETL